MIAGVALEIWAIALGVVLINVVVTLLLNIFAAKAAYRRGYEAAHVGVEALALGRLMEASRERYFAGDALARALESHDHDDDPPHPADRAQ